MYLTMIDVTILQYSTNSYVHIRNTVSGYTITYECMQMRDGEGDADVLQYSILERGAVSTDCTPGVCCLTADFTPLQYYLV